MLYSDDDNNFNDCVSYFMKGNLMSITILTPCRYLKSLLTLYILYHVYKLYFRIDNIKLRSLKII